MGTSVTRVNVNRGISQSFIIRPMIGERLYRLLNHQGWVKILITVSKRISCWHALESSIIFNIIFCLEIPHLRNRNISFLKCLSDSSTILTLVSNLGPGWINIGEAYLYVPLSIFRKFTPGAMINFKDQTKRRFLENNRHCLLRHMPIEYQKLFFFGRHNLGNLFEQLEKLAFMGLITFENIQKRQKEQGFTDRTFELLLANRTVLGNEK